MHGGAAGGLCGRIRREMRRVVRIDADSVVNRGYIGQRGPVGTLMPSDYGQGRVEISDADWAKLYARLDFMRPAFIRVMTNTTSVVRNGRLDRMRGFEHLSHILGYCQSRGVTVMFGDWGGSLMDARTGTVNRTLLDHAAAYVAWLVGEKGYDCIRYYNLVNEPNGFWSAADGDFDLWAKAVSYFRGRLDAEGLAGKVELVGPDAAIWGPEEAWWVSRSRDELGDRIGLYDIHTYPSKCTVNSGEYTRILEAYRREVPAGKKIVMGEIGFKFVEPADSLLQAENLRRAAAHPNASTDDSQMFVYDPMYGTDMADALFQTIHGGLIRAASRGCSTMRCTSRRRPTNSRYGVSGTSSATRFRSRRGTGAPVVLCLVAAVPHAAAGKRLLRSRRAGCRRGQGRRRRERRTAHRRHRERVARTAPRADRVSGLEAVQAGNPLSLRRGADAHGGRPHAVARRHRPAD